MSSKRKRSASPNLTQEAPVERSFSSSSSSWNEAPISQKGKGKAAAPGTIAGTAATPGSTSGSASSTTRTDAPGSSTAMLGDLFTYQEIFLRVLSFLSPGDLAKGQGVNRYWARMTLDPQLWKRMYLARYPHPHDSRLIYRQGHDPPGSSRSTPSRPLRRLPSRAFPPPSPSRTPSRTSVRAESPSQLSQREAPLTPVAISQDSSKEVQDRLDARDDSGWGIRNDGVDWKMMLRLETNWSNGNALSETTISLPPSPSPTITSETQGTTPSQLSGPSRHTEQHIALFPSFIATSNVLSPLVHVYEANLPRHPTIAGTGDVPPKPLVLIPPPPGWSSPHRPDNVTAICADQSVSPQEVASNGKIDQKPVLPARLAVFYSSGGFVVVHLNMTQSRLVWRREAIYPPTSRPRSTRQRVTAYVPVHGDPVVLAALHHPVLVTCTLAFHLSTYLVTHWSDGDPVKPRHLSTMHSDTAFHPAVLTLFPAPSRRSKSSDAARHFDVALTYCSPLYPSSWTAASQDITVDLDEDLSSGEACRGECHTVSSKLISSSLEWPRRIQSVVGVKGRRASGIGADGRWAVLSGDDNQIQVYCVPSSSPESTRAWNSAVGSENGIKHAQTLLAHSASVTSLSLLNGRCVSGGRDGRVLVWELDDHEGDTSVLDAECRKGRTVGHVEVKRGGRRQWLGPSGPIPLPPPFPVSHHSPRIRKQSKWNPDLPHPASISAAARSLFLPRPPAHVRDVRPASIGQLQIDEEKIVGLVRVDQGVGRGVEEVLKVWSFNT